MGLLKLNERLGDKSYGEAFDGVFPKTSPQGGCVSGQGRVTPRVIVVNQPAHQCFYFQVL